MIKTERLRDNNSRENVVKDGTVPVFRTAERRNRSFFALFFAFMHLGVPEMQVGIDSLFFFFILFYDADVTEKHTEKRQI